MVEIIFNIGMITILGTDISQGTGILSKDNFWIYLRKL